MIKTPLCDLLGIKYPIIQGGMAWVAEANLAAAVSNAGGLGLIAAMNADADFVRKEIRKAKKLTNKVFGVNIMLMSPYADEVSDIVIEEGVKVVTTGAGSPRKYMEKWINAGIKVVPVVASVAQARMMEKSGAVAVVAEGCEAGGHIGSLTTMALVPQVVDAVSIPVVAAGGIADGRGFVAAIMLGAVGVQIGTRFIVADECTVHENFKDKIIKAKDIDTMVTGNRFGHPVRALKNKFTRDFNQLENDFSSTQEQADELGTGSLYRAVVEGDEENGGFLAGQISGLVKAKQPAKVIIEEIMTQAEGLITEVSKWVK